VDVLTGADSTLGPPETVQPFAPPAAASLQSRNAAGEVAEARWEGGKGSATATFADGRKTACIDPMCSTARIAALSWRPASHDVMVTFLDRERRQSLYLWSLEPNSLRKVAESDGLLAGGRRHMVPCALSASAAFCIAASPGSPPRLERIELESGARQVLFDPNPELRSAYRPKVTYLHWAIGDGRDAAGVLLQPPGKAGGSMPLYVNYYSCEGFLRGGEGDEWPLPQLLDAGFAAACINAVPSTGPQDGVKEYETGLAAVRTLVGKLSREGIVDPSRVAMGGLSFGSEVAMWTAIHSRLLAALSISSAQLEPADYWASAMPGSDQPSIIDRVWKLGTPGQTPVRWREVSPALNTGRIQVPILFQLPEQEARRIPELYARLAMAGVPTELYAFPDEAHIKVQPRHRLAVYERNLDWFRYWLQDFMDPDPAKASQYERWNKLKLAWRASRRPSARNVAKVQARPSR
jgi:dipeptidyl aminopeptidase/acylaminoacyl peptidase